MSKKQAFDTVYGEPFVSPIIRPQYVSLAEPDTGHKYSRENYCLTALLPKLDKKGLRELLQSVADTAGCDLDSVNELEKHPLLDGDGNFRDGDDKAHAQKEGHAGSYFFIVGSQNQPETYVIDAESGEPVECDPKEIYAGCYCQLVLQPAMYGEGEVTFYLNAVMKVDDGDRFKASRIDAKSLFTNWAKGNVKDASPPKAAAPKKVVAAAPIEDEGDEDAQDAPKRGRGRPPKLNGNGVSHKAAAKIVQEDEGDDSYEEEEVDSYEENEKKLKAAHAINNPPLVIKRERKLKSSIKDLLD